MRAPPLPHALCRPQKHVLSEHVVGQEDAVECISTALCRARCGLKDPRRPSAALLFVGPTGGSGGGVGGWGDAGA